MRAADLDIASIPLAGTIGGDEQFLVIENSQLKVKTVDSLLSDKNVVSSVTDPVTGGISLLAGAGTALLDKNNIVLSQVAPADALTAAVNPTSGNLNSTYYYSVTFSDGAGETSSGAAVTVSPANQQVDLSGIPVSTDARVKARKIYRTAAGATDVLSGKLCATIADNTTTTYTDNLVDGSLGVAMPWVNTTGGQIFNGAVRIGVADVSTTSFGYGAMPNNTGYANSAFGVSALASNTTGLRNIAFGTFALTANTIGSVNTAFGIHALGANISGGNNTAVGFSALWKSTASENSALGVYALGANVGGADNTAFGYRSAATIVSSANITAVGAYAFTNGTGAGNTAIGMSAMYSASTGANNTAVGYQALQSVGAGAANVAVGVQAGSGNTGSSSVFIGFQAGYFETGSNKLFIDNRAWANEATARASALIYGVFNATAANQTLAINASLAIAQQIIESTDALTGTGGTPAAVSITKTTTKLTTSATGDALTLANGVDGQIKRVILDVLSSAGHTMILTPTTKTGYTTITLTAAGQSASLQYVTTRGWIVVGSFGVTIA